MHPSQWALGYTAISHNPQTTVTYNMQAYFLKWLIKSAHDKLNRNVKCGSRFCRIFYLYIMIFIYAHNIFIPPPLWPISVHTHTNVHNVCAWRSVIIAFIFFSPEIASFLQLHIWTDNTIKSLGHTESGCGASVDTSNGVSSEQSISPFLTQHFPTS